MADFHKISQRAIDFAERLANVATAATGNRTARESVTTRWVVLPAVGAGLYALVRSRFFTRQTMGVVDDANTRALPSHRLTRVPQRSQKSPSGGRPRSRESSTPKTRRGRSVRVRPSARKQSSSHGRSPAKSGGRNASDRYKDGRRSGSASRSGQAEPEAADRSGHAFEEHLALRAMLGNVLDVIAGIHVNADELEADVRGIEADMQLQVRPANLDEVVDRAAAILEPDPES
jgi:hypothetical protein